MSVPGRCPACFEPLADGQVCECNYDAEAETGPLVLQPGTVLRPDPGQGQDQALYSLGMLLGDGTFGLTYLGWDHARSEKVAIKEYVPRELVGRAHNSFSVKPHAPSHREPFEWGLDRFLQEAEALRQFSHPNVVKVSTFFKANRTAYLVMPYYPGKTLGQWLTEKKKMDPAVAVDMMMSVLDGLRHVHNTKVNRKRWMHRDVKPDNILLRQGQGPLLIDFGAARLEVGERSKAVTLVVTPEFAPNEQVLGIGAQGPFVDVYACAATLYLTVTGERPVRSTERANAVNNGRLDPLKSPDHYEPKLPKALTSAILEGMALAPERRPEDAGRYQPLLKAAADALRPREPDPVTPPVREDDSTDPEPLPPLTLKPAVWIPAAIALVAIAAILAVLLARALSEANDLQQRVDALSSDLEDQSSRTRAAEAAGEATARQLAALQQEASGTRAELAGVRQDLTDERQQAAGAEAESHGLAARVRQQASEISGLRATNVSLQQKLTDAQQRLNTAPLPANHYSFHTMTVDACRAASRGAIEKNRLKPSTYGNGDYFTTRPSLSAVFVCTDRFWFITVVGQGDVSEAVKLREALAGFMPR